MTLPVSRPRRGMAVTPYRTGLSREMQDLQDRLSQLTQTFFGDVWPMGPVGRAATMAPVDIEETDQAFIVDLDLPNVAPQDVNIELRGDELRVTGQYQRRERGGVIRRQMRQEGEFEFLIDLPAEVDPENVSAKLENGVLTITAPKARQSQSRRIEVQATGEQQQPSGQGKSQQRQQSGQQGHQAQHAR